MKMRTFNDLTLEELRAWLVEYAEATEGWGILIEDMEEEIKRREKLEEYRIMRKNYDYFFLQG